MRDKLVKIIPLAMYDHYRTHHSETRRGWRVAPDHCCNALYFGLIRPYKGLEDLVRAFDMLSPVEVERYWLTVVGETWEGWDLPGRLIAQSRYRHRITFINRYVSDAEADQAFRGADLVVLPYHRASQSGVLHIAMNYGLPIIVTNVGSMKADVSHYEGALLIEPQDQAALAGALRQAPSLCGRRFANRYTWRESAQKYATFAATLMTARGDHEPARSVAPH